MPVNRVLIQTALLSGGLAALAGWSEVAGLKGHLSQDLSPGFGYTGIIVAMLALLNPLAVIGTAIFVAGIFVGSDAMSRAAGVPTYIADMLLASALLFSPRVLYPTYLAAEAAGRPWGLDPTAAGCVLYNIRYHFQTRLADFGPIWEPPWRVNLPPRPAARSPHIARNPHIGITETLRLYYEAPELLRNLRYL